MAAIWFLGLAPAVFLPGALNRLVFAPTASGSTQDGLPSVSQRPNLLNLGARRRDVLRCAQL